MNKSDQTQKAFDSGTIKKEIIVVRYMGVKNITDMMERGQHIEAFAHVQLDVEKILWNKIVGIFEGEKAMIVRRTI